MHVDVTNTQVIIGGFSLVFNIFGLSAFAYNRWSKVASPRDFGSDCNPNSLLQSPCRDNKEELSNLHTRYADLCASSLGTAQQRITFRSKTQQNLVGFESEGCSRQNARMASDLGVSSAPPPLDHAARLMSPETSTQESRTELGFSFQLLDPPL